MAGTGVGTRLLVGLTWIAFSVVACTGPAGSTSPSPDAKGILIVNVGEKVQAAPPNEVLGQAWSDAMTLAEANGADLGYPWIDPASGELVLSVVTTRGSQLVEAAAITFAHRTRNVSHGATELRHIQDDVTFLHSRGVPDSELIYATLPDHRDNRVLILISAASPSLLEYLAAHYPPDALAVEVDPSGAGGAPADAP